MKSSKYVSRIYGIKNPNLRRGGDSSKPCSGKYRIIEPRRYLWYVKTTPDLGGVRGDGMSRVGLFRNLFGSWKAIFVFYYSVFVKEIKAPLVDEGYKHSILTIYQYSRFGAISWLLLIFGRQLFCRKWYVILQMTLYIQGECIQQTYPNNN